MMQRSSMALALLLLSAFLATASASHCSSGGSTYLYVWAGSADASRAKDALFTLRMCDSGKDPQFAKLWAYSPTPYNNIEPHHIAISSNGRTLGAGGLLAALSGLPSIYFYDITNPANPKLMKNIDQASKSAIADAFLPTPDGGFLVTMMGSNTGASPGRIAQYNASLRLVQEAPSDDNFLGNTGFNPHGIAVNWATKTMVTSDFIDPASTYATNGVAGLIARTTVRVWNTDTMKMTAILDTSADAGIPGHMDCTTVGTSGLFYSTRLNGFLYLINTTASPPTIAKAFDFGAALNTLPGAGGGLVKSFRNGTRLAVTSFSQSKVFLLDTSNPAAPTLLSQISFGDGAGAHLLTLSKNERLMAVSTYFLDEATGNIKFPGDQTVRLVVLDAAASTLTPHPLVPIVDFKKLKLPNGARIGFKPHGMAFSPK